MKDKEYYEQQIEIAEKRLRLTKLLVKIMVGACTFFAFMLLVAILQIIF